MAGNLPAARWTRVSRPAQICDKIPQTISMVRIPQKRKIVKPIFQFCGPDFPSANTNRLPLKRHAPIASVAAFPAQPLAALPPYGCGVPLRVVSAMQACNKDGIPSMARGLQICHCEGAPRPWQSREGTPDPYRPPLKRCWPPDLSLRGGRRPTWQSREGTPRSVPAAVKTVLAPRFVIARRP